MAATLGRKASEVVGRLFGATKKDDGGGGGGDKVGDRRKKGGDDDDRGGRCSESGASSFSFLDNMCGPMLRFGGVGDAAVPVGESDDADDLPADSDRAGRGRGGGRDDRGRKGRDGGGGGGGGRGVGAGGGRRPTGSYDYDDETNATDATGSYEDDDETYDDDRKKPSSSSSRGRGRDRKPRSPIESPSEATSPYSEFDDDTTQNDTVLSEAPYNNSKGGKEEDNGNKKSSSTNKQPSSSSSAAAAANKKKEKEKEKEDIAAKDTREKMITQPLASGFAKRCYFTKAGIGRTTQHYEGLTLTGNTVLMLAAAMKLKGCPTICDEDLRRVETTYPNQFSRLPDELLLSSGWRRISKYCHFSHKPLPDGVPFFHSRKRCHANGGFYFLLCSAVGMTRLMDVEPLNRDALAVLQTDFPMTCDKAPVALMEEPSEWTLVDKFCFFSGGPINVEEDVFYRAELGGTEIYMLAFLSPSLSPEELYRLEREPNGGGGGGGKKQEDAGPLKSVAAVEEVESVYDLTDRDFEDLKLYHLGPYRALPQYLLHPQSWTKVLPPHFVAARDEALRIAQEWESRRPTSAMRGPHSNAGSSTTPLAQGSGGSNMMMTAGSPGSGYVELGQARGRPPPSSRGGVGPVGPVYPSQYPGMHQEQTNGMDPNAQYYPLPMMGVPDQQAGYSPLHHHYGAHLTPIDNDVNYYYSPRMMPPGAHSPGAHFQQQLHMPPHSTMANPYGNPNMSAPSPTRMSHMHGGIPYDAGQYQPYPNAPPAQLRMGDPQWIDIHEEGAFGRAEGGDQPDDEAIATRGGAFGGTNKGGPRGVGGMMHHQMMDPNIEHQYHHQVDPPVNAYEDSDVGTDHQHCDDNKSVASGTSSLMGGAQNRLKQKRLNRNKDSPRRPDLSTKLGKMMTKSAVLSVAEDSWETRTDAESSLGTSLVSAESSMYTDSTNPNEKSSRRALILQMAKARMKNVKESTAADNNNVEVSGETGVNVIADTAVDEMCMQLD